MVQVARDTTVMSTAIRRIVIGRAKPEAIQYSGVFWIASQARNDGGAYRHCEDSERSEEDEAIQKNAAY